jgi:hypothetical protein
LVIEDTALIIYSIPKPENQQDLNIKTNESK